MKGIENERLSEVMLRVLTPAGQTAIEEKKPASHVDSLDGKRLGLVYNQKPGGDNLLARTAELFQERFKDVEVNWFSRECCQEPPTGFIEAAVKGSDVVVAAAAD